MIQPAVTLYWQEQEIRRLRVENDQLRAVLGATQKALKEMQRQRDLAREGRGVGVGFARAKKNPPAP